MASSFQKDFPVPEQFPAVLHDFAREILRVQPECIYSFGVEYFEKLLQNENIDFPSKYNVPRQEQTAHFQYGRVAEEVPPQEAAQQEVPQESVAPQDLDHDHYSEMAQSYVQSLNKNSMKEFLIENEVKATVVQQEPSRVVEVAEPQEEHAPEEEPKPQVQEEDEEQTLQTFKLKDD